MCHKTKRNETFSQFPLDIVKNKLIRMSRIQILEKSFCIGISIWFSRFYGISNIVGYLKPKLSL